MKGLAPRALVVRYAGGDEKQGIKPGLSLPYHTLSRFTLACGDDGALLREISVYAFSAFLALSRFVTESFEKQTREFYSVYY